MRPGFGLLVRNNRLLPQTPAQVERFLPHAHRLIVEGAGEVKKMARVFAIRGLRLRIGGCVKCEDSGRAHFALKRTILSMISYRRESPEPTPAS